MKSFSVFLLAALFVIFIASVTEVKCQDDCTPLNNICGEDEMVCCENYDCIYVDNMKTYFCLDNTTVLDNGNVKVEHGKCSYYKTEPINEATKRALINQYGEFHASHSLIPIGTKVMVTTNNRTVTVVINNLSPMKKSGELELSDEAANALAVWDDGVVECNLQVQPEEFSISKYLIKPAIVIVVYFTAVVLSSYW